MKRFVGQTRVECVSQCLFPKNPDLKFHLEGKKQQQQQRQQQQQKTERHFWDKRHTYLDSHVKAHTVHLECSESDSGSVCLGPDLYFSAFIHFWRPAVCPSLTKKALQAYEWGRWGLCVWMAVFVTDAQADIPQTWTREREWRYWWVYCLFREIQWKGTSLSGRKNLQLFCCYRERM